MTKLPDDIFKQELLLYFTLDDIVKLDSACMNHKYRSQLLEKISGVILRGDDDNSMKASLFEWLGMRRIYLINIQIVVCMNHKYRSQILDKIYISENDYVDQFRYTQYVVMRGSIRDDMAIFIISHCSCLLSIEFSGIHNYFSSSPRITDHTLQSIAEHCTGQLQSLSLSDCGEITDIGLITISKQSLGLHSLKVNKGVNITNASIISISIYCTRLQSLELESCEHITDASIISISTHCTGLQSLNLESCHHISDVSIISISTHCTGLKSLNLNGCVNISDASIISISTHCTGLKSLNLRFCRQITDASIISISENCTGLKRLDISYTTITDSSVIAIAKKCTELRLFDTYGCHG